MRWCGIKSVWDGVVLCVLMANLTGCKGSGTGAVVVAPPVSQSPSITNTCTKIAAGDSRLEVRWSLVFLGDSDSTDFVDYDAYINGVLQRVGSIEPFQSLSGYFDIYQVDKPLSDLCGEGAPGMTCDWERTRAVAEALCPKVDVLLVISEDSFKSYTIGERDSFVSIGHEGTDKPLSSKLLGCLAVHEFGHSVGRLSDEYTVAEWGSRPGVNCIAQGLAPDWSDLFPNLSPSDGRLSVISPEEDVYLSDTPQQAALQYQEFARLGGSPPECNTSREACVSVFDPTKNLWPAYLATYSRGCAFTIDNFRPTLNSVMRSYLDFCNSSQWSESFGPINQHILKSAIESGPPLRLGTQTAPDVETPVIPCKMLPGDPALQGL